MKAGFNLTNPTIIGVDWSFVPEISRETVAEDQALEEGEVTGGAREAEDVVILDELEQPMVAEQPTEPDQPPSPGQLE